MQAELETKLQMASIALRSEGGLELEEWQVLSVIATLSDGKEMRLPANDGSGDNKNKIHIDLQSMPEDAVDLEVIMQCSLFPTRRVTTDAQKHCSLQTTHQQHTYKGYTPYVDESYLLHFTRHQDRSLAGSRHNGSLFNTHVTCVDNKRYVPSPVFFPFRGFIVPSKPKSVELVIADASKRFVEEFTFSFSGIAK